MQDLVKQFLIRVYLNMLTEIARIPLGVDWSVRKLHSLRRQPSLRPAMPDLHSSTPHNVNEV